MRLLNLRTVIASMVAGAMFAFVAMAEEAAPAKPQGLLIPKLRIPKIAKPPVIDGKMDADEWSGASSVTGFMNFIGQYMLPKDLQPVWWIAYDDSFLYLAQKYPLYPKGTIKAVIKQGDCGGISAEADRILWDDHVEIEISDLPERRMAPKNYFYKFMTNPYGALVDQRMEWSVGWQGFEWESGAALKSTVDDDYWTFEMAIPFKSMKHDKAPSDGTRWYMQLVSAGDPGSYYFAWQPTSWLDFDRFPEIVFDSKAPAVHIESFGDLMDGHLGLSVGINSNSTASVTVAVDVVNPEGKTLFNESKTAEASSGKPAKVEIKANLLLDDTAFKTGKRQERVDKEMHFIGLKATSADGTVLCEMRPAFVKTPADIKPLLYDLIANSHGKAGAPVLKTCYYHYEQKLEAKVDVDILLIKPELRAAQNFRARIVEKKSGKVLAQDTGFIMPNGQGILMTSTPAFDEGDYEAVVEIVGKDGKVLAEKKDPFTVRRFPWENTQVGKDRIVVQPFQPVQVSDKTLSVWERNYTFGDTGFPSSITALGKEILSAPIILQGKINGKEESLSTRSWPRWTEISGHNSTLKSSGALGPVTVDVTADTEYDGATMYTLTLSPSAPSKLERLDLVIPLKGMTHYNVWRSGRDVVMGKLPDADGIFWESNKLSPAPNIYGTFLPVAYCGDGERGLVWCADSDQGWILDDALSSFFLERRNGELVMRARLCNKTAFLRQARTIRFTLQALPPKPMAPDYRYRAWEGGTFNAPVTGALSCWWAYGTGPTVSFYKPEHYQVFKKQISDEKTQAMKRQADEPGPKYEPLSRWYVATNTTGLAMPEYDCYSGAWLGTTYKIPEPEAHYKNGKTPWGEWTEPRQQCRAFADLLQYTVDCRVYAFDQHQKQCGLNGYWWDHDRFWSSGSLVKGTAYVREDGKAQGIFNISLMRQMMKRMATCAEINAIRPWHGYYAPNNVGPISAFCQYNWAVEGPWFMSSDKNDLMDNIHNLENMKIWAGRYTGNPTSVAPATMETGYQNGDTKRYPFQSRNIHGMGLLMDIGIRSSGTRHEEYMRLIQCLRDFNYFDARVEWVPFWRSGEMVSFDKPGMVATVYRRSLPGIPTAAMLVVFNETDKDVTANLKCDEMKLIGRSGAVLSDVELKEKSNAQNAQWKELAIKRHDYRLLVLE